MLTRAIKVSLFGVIGTFLVIAAVFVWPVSGTREYSSLPAINNFNGITIVPHDLQNYSFAPLKFHASAMGNPAYWSSGACNGDMCINLSRNPQALLETGNESWYLLEYNVSCDARVGPCKENLYRTYVGLFSLSPNSETMKYHGEVYAGGLLKPGKITRVSGSGTTSEVTYTFTSAFSESDWDDVVHKEKVLSPDKMLRLQLAINTNTGDIRLIDTAYQMIEE